MLGAGVTRHHASPDTRGSLFMFSRTAQDSHQPEEQHAGWGAGRKQRRAPHRREAAVGMLLTLEAALGPHTPQREQGQVPPSITGRKSKGAAFIKLLKRSLWAPSAAALSRTHSTFGKPVLRFLVGLTGLLLPECPGEWAPRAGIRAAPASRPSPSPCKSPPTCTFCPFEPRISAASLLYTRS